MLRRKGLMDYNILLIPKLILGLFLASLGTVMMIHANIGLFPWGILNAGLSNASGLSFGVWSQIIGLMILMIMAIFKHYPGLGTLFDIFFVGFFIDLIEASRLMPSPDHLVMKLILSITGLFVLSYGVSLYMRCGLGAGPRDGLMLMLMKMTGGSVTVVKSVIELSVTVLGLLLGGPFGFGTIMLAILGGKVMNLVFKWTNYDASKVPQKSLLDLWKQQATV